MTSIEEPKPPDRGKRPDKALAAYEKSFFRYSVLKTKLNQFVNNQNQKQMIETSVQLINRIAYSSYHFINILFLDFLEKKKPLPQLTDNFFYKASCFSSKLNQEWTPPQEGDWLEVFNKYKKVVETTNFPIPDRNKHCFLVTNLSLMMKIASTNHLNLNFCRRMNRYLRIIHGLDDNALINYMIDRIFGKEIDPQHPCKFDTERGIQILICFYKKKFSFPTLETVITDQLNVFMPFYLNMLQTFEKHETKKFSILPLKGELILSHTTIDHTSFKDLVTNWEGKKKKKHLANVTNRINKLKNKLSKSKGKDEIVFRKTMKTEIKKWKEKSSPEVTPLKEFVDKRTQWSKVFKFDRYETRNHWFDWKITTNGYDVSVYYKVPLKHFPFTYLQWNHEMSQEEKLDWCRNFYENKRRLKASEDEKKKKEIEEHNEVQIIKWEDWKYFLGLDPGKRSLFSTTDQNGQQKQCKKEEYRHLTGFAKRQRQIVKRKDANPLSKELQKYSFKVSKVENYLGNLKEVMKLYPSLEKEYSKDFYRKNKFTCYQKKIKTFHILQNRLTGGGERTIIGFGNGSVNGPKIRGNTMPVKGFKKFLERTESVLVIGINEYLTTKQCSSCKERTGEVKFWKEYLNRNGVSLKRLQKIYGLRRCSNNECRITWDRDANASKNILILLLSVLKREERPLYLSKNRIGNLSKESDHLERCESGSSSTETIASPSASLSSAQLEYSS